MAFSMNYSLSAQDVLTHPEMPKRLQQMRHAGVKHLWLYGFFYGHHESAPEQLIRARRRLLDEGFETGVLSLPVGHPGNSLNPEDPTLNLAIHNEWHYRIDRHGKKEYFIACIDDIMTRHNRSAAEMYAQMGFTRHFYDDDLRLGNWGEQVQGCFCDRCIQQFNDMHGLCLTRAQLAEACDGTTGMEEIREAWIQFNCDKLTRFMRDTQVPGMASGIMVMHNGDRRHGISIPDIRRAVPGCMFRVGELHFNDASYATPKGQESLASSVRAHMALIGDNPVYSESTVFPAEALSPENLLHRIRLELSLGLRNIFLMSGTWYLSEPYWNLLVQNRSALETLADELDAIHDTVHEDDK